MNKREIPKVPKVPVLNKQAIDLITELCFRQDDAIDLSSADAVFVFGTCVSVMEAVNCCNNALNKAKAKLLILSGGVADYLDSYTVAKPESEYFSDKIKAYLHSDVDVKLEKISKNCLENVTFSLKYLSAVENKALVFITKSLAAGRNYLTLKKYLQDTKLLQQSYDATYPENNKIIAKDNWYKDRESISRVYGEYLRVKTYGGRGDIAYEEVKGLVDKIEQLTT